MKKGKKEAMDLAIEIDIALNTTSRQAYILLANNTDQKERRSLERLIDSIERSKDDVRRAML